MSREKLSWFCIASACPPAIMALPAVRALAGRQRAQDHGADHPGRLAALLCHQARDMALGHVAEFVRQHRRQFVARGGDVDQAQLQAEPAAGQRERVDDAVLAQQHLPGEAVVELRGEFAARAGGGQQPLPDVLHVLVQDGVVDVVRVAVQLARDPLAEFALGAASSSRWCRPRWATGPAPAAPATRKPMPARQPRPPLRGARRGAGRRALSN